MHDYAWSLIRCDLAILEAKLADDLRIFLGLMLDVGGEVSAAFRIRIERLQGKLLLDLGHGERLAEPADELRNRLLRRLCRRHDTKPDVGRKIRVAGFRDRRQ